MSLQIHIIRRWKLRTETAAINQNIQQILEEKDLDSCW
jgi:hypothetical protein